MPATPPALHEGHRANFTTLLAAAKAHRVGLVSSIRIALVSSIRKSDGAPVALICAVNIDDSGSEPFYGFVPLAVMVEGDPYEDFEDPTLLPPDLIAH